MSTPTYGRLHCSFDVTDLSPEAAFRFRAEGDRLLERYRAEAASNSGLTVLGWTAHALHLALRRLRQSNGSAQADLIEWALRNGGVVPRLKVYEIAGFSEERSLRGFTRPALRVKNELINEDLIEEEATSLIKVRYKRGETVASAFVVPIDLADLLHR